MKKIIRQIHVMIQFSDMTKIQLRLLNSRPLERSKSRKLFNVKKSHLPVIYNLARIRAWVLSSNWSLETHSIRGRNIHILLIQNQSCTNFSVAFYPPSKIVLSPKKAQILMGSLVDPAKLSSNSIQSDIEAVLVKTLHSGSLDNR